MASLASLDISRGPSCTLEGGLTSTQDTEAVAATLNQCAALLEDLPDPVSVVGPARVYADDVMVEIDADPPRTPSPIPAADPVPPADPIPPPPPEIFQVAVQPTDQVPCYSTRTPLFLN